jgi:hypothetical protein
MDDPGRRTTAKLLTPRRGTADRGPHRQAARAAAIKPAGGRIGLDQDLPGHAVFKGQALPQGVPRVSRQQNRRTKRVRAWAQMPMGPV